MIKVIIAGGRNFTDYDLLDKEVSSILNSMVNIPMEEMEIVSGRCPVGELTYITEDKIKVYGADGLAEKYAKENNFKFTPFPADFKRFGNYGGPKRNKEMAEYTAPDGIAIIFWNLQSRGAKSMIDEANKLNLKVHIINYE